MAVSKTGISRLFQSSTNINSNVGEGGKSNPIGDFIVARVIDVNLNSNSELFNKAGGLVWYWRYQFCIS